MNRFKRKRALGSEWKMKDEAETIKVPVILDRQRCFHLNIAAVARWEAKSDRAFFGPSTWTRKYLSQRTFLRDMAFLLWCSLVEDDPKLKPEDMVKLMEDKNIDWEAAMSKLEASWRALINTFAVI